MAKLKMAKNKEKTFKVRLTAEEVTFLKQHHLFENVIGKSNLQHKDFLEMEVTNVKEDCWPRCS